MKINSIHHLKSKPPVTKIGQIIKSSWDKTTDMGRIDHNLFTGVQKTRMTKNLSLRHILG